MLDDFFIRAVIAGIVIAIATGTLGCFIVWRKMSYFGDSLAHSALLGIALGLLYGFNLNIATIIVCTIFAILLLWLQHRSVLATDTLLGILAHAGLAMGMVAISFLDDTHFDLHDYFFGDIFSLTIGDLYWICGGGFAIIALLIYNWSSLTLMTINEDLAKAEGINTLLMNILLMLLMTIVVAISMHIIGILLITSMLIIPAATARILVRSPEAMAICAVFLGAVSVVIGLFCAINFETPSGPTIVTAATAIFIILLPISRFITRA